MAIFRTGSSNEQAQLRQFIQSGANLSQLATFVSQVRRASPAVEAAFLFLQPGMDSFLESMSDEEPLKGEGRGRWRGEERRGGVRHPIVTGSTIYLNSV